MIRAVIGRNPVLITLLTMKGERFDRQRSQVVTRRKR